MAWEFLGINDCKNRKCNV